MDSICKPVCTVCEEGYLPANNICLPSCRNSNFAESYIPHCTDKICTSGICNKCEDGY